MVQQVRRADTLVGKHPAQEPIKDEGSNCHCGGVERHGMLGGRPEVLPEPDQQHGRVVQKISIELRKNPRRYLLVVARDVLNDVVFGAVDNIPASNAMNQQMPTAEVGGTLSPAPTCMMVSVAPPNTDTSETGKRAYSLNMARW